jgi:hypothetical protein
MAEKIVFTVKPDGSMEVEGKDFKGSSCLEKASKYMSGLGTVTDQKFKDDYYEIPAKTDINVIQ